MKKTFFASLIIIFSLFFTTQTYAISEKEIASRTVKVMSYQHQPLMKTFSNRFLESGILLDEKRVLTSLSALIDFETKEFLGSYQVCFIATNNKETRCSGSVAAKVVGYDPTLELAILELSTPQKNIKPLKFEVRDFDIGEELVAYGFGSESLPDPYIRVAINLESFEQDQYKISKGLDRAMTGGAFFDQKGNFSGLITSIVSNDETLSYMIPVSIIVEFINETTEDFEKKKDKVQPTFEKYVQNVSSLQKNGNLVSSPLVTIKDFEKNGFYLSWTQESLDRKIFDYRFLTKDRGVMIQVACSIEWENTQKTLEEQLSNMKTWYSSTYPEEVVTTNFKDKIYAGIEYKTTLEDGYSRSDIYMNHRKYPCHIYIQSHDSKKYKKQIEKARSLIKNVTFQNATKVQKFFSSEYFSTQSIPPELRISNEIQEDSTLTPMITNITTPDFKTWGILIENKPFLVDFLTANKDKVISSTWEEFASAFIETSASDVSDEKIATETITSKNGRTILLATTDNTTTGVRSLWLVYAYTDKINTEKWRTWDVYWEYNGKNIDFENAIRDLAKNMTLPGFSPFKN